MQAIEQAHYHLRSSGRGQALHVYVAAAPQRPRAHALEPEQELSA